MRQIILDVETTGLQTSEGHRIIEIGCVELVNRKFTQKTFHQYINPEREIDDGALAVHGISREFLLGKPVFLQIVQELMDFISGAELIIHNAPFDVGFLNYELMLTKQHWKTVTDYCRVTDTLVMARQMHIGQRNGLDALCKRYGIDNSHREFHGALLDSHLLAQVYLAMTGGQGSLFDGAQSHEPVMQAEEATTKKRTQQQRQLKVLCASEEDLVLHEEKLQKMVAKGKCIWIPAPGTENTSS